MEINIPAVYADVEHAFNRYQQALMDNDMAVLNDLFWNSPLTLRFGINDNQYGYTEITAFRTQRNPNDVKRTIGKQVITTFGQDAASTNLEFFQGETFGRQSQTWVRMADGWKIVAAHVSHMKR